MHGITVLDDARREARWCMRAVGAAQFVVQRQKAALAQSVAV
jgi:hypothetical protein